MNRNPLRVSEGIGQSIGLTHFRRPALQTGEIKQLIDQDGTSGLTANPSCFEKAIHALALDGKGFPEMYAAFTREDVQPAADLSRAASDYLATLGEERKNALGLP